MKFSRSQILPDVILIEPRVFQDDRGYFFESFQETRYQEAGIHEKFVQDNVSHSCKGTLRGMHYQLKHPQGKLVSVIRGAVFDAVIDLRKNSPTFGKWAGFELNEDNHLQLYVPPGFGHGFYVLSEYADFHYKCTDFYAHGDEYGVIWNDPDVGIEWPIDVNPKLSEKDAENPKFIDIPKEHLF